MWETEYEDWLLETGSSPNTTRQRLVFARRIAREYGTLVPPAAELARFLARYHGWSRRAYHGHLTSLYEWMVETDQIARSPLARIKAGPTPQPKARPLSEAEMMRALTAATRPHVRTWMLLAALAGLRSHEIAKMHGRDITESFLHVLGKGGKDCSVPTHPVLWEVAQQYPRGGHWFPSTHPDRPHVHTRLVGLRVAEAFRAAGLPVGSVHRLRATFGTNLMRNGVPTRVIQELMRHASLATTEAYLGVLDQDLRDAVESLAA